MAHIDAEHEFQEVTRFDNLKAANEWDGVTFFFVQDPLLLLEEIQKKVRVRVAIKPLPQPLDLARELFAKWDLPTCKLGSVTIARLVSVLRPPT